jgi:hypothetical protein
MHTTKVYYFNINGMHFRSSGATCFDLLYGQPQAALKHD